MRRRKLHDAMVHQSAWLLSNRRRRNRTGRRPLLGRRGRHQAGPGCGSRPTGRRCRWARRGCRRRRRHRRGSWCGCRS
jgi:hypothetical protein